MEQTPETNRCAGDACRVTYPEGRTKGPDWNRDAGQPRRMADGLEDRDFRKLKDWFRRMAPMDYDAPGTTVREMGV